MQYSIFQDFMSCASEVNSDEEMEQARSDTEEQFEMVSVSDGPVNDEKYDLGAHNFISIGKRFLKF